MGKSVEYYLSKGYDRKMAEYFASGRKRITKVIPRNDFTLLLSFDNGETRLYDAFRPEPYLHPSGNGIISAEYIWTKTTASAGTLTPILTAMMCGTTRWTCVRTAAMWTAFLFIDIEPENPAAELQRDLLLLLLFLFHVFSQNKVNVL